MKVTHTTYDIRDGKVVPVIASYDTEGHIKILYIGISGKQFKVKESYLYGNDKDAIRLYFCRVIDGNMLRDVYISYHSREWVWFLHKSKPDFFQH